MRPVRVIIINELEAKKKPFRMFKVVFGIMETSQKRTHTQNIKVGTSQNEPLS